VVPISLPMPAGVERMPLARFCLFTTVGSAVWNTLFVIVGYLLGAKWQQAEQFANWATWAVLALAVLWVVKFVVTRLRRERTTA
jgi:membrane protein DedA with SNARE-associated domain